MSHPFYNWSETAASNASADSTVNWAEGQAPSSVNDSARAMMASLAAYRDDNSGSLTTGGISTAFTLTTNQVFDSLAHLANQELAFTMSATSGAAPTLAVDGLTAKPIRNATGVVLPTGALLSGSVYHVSYNNSSGEFLIQNQPAVLPSNIVVTGNITDANVSYAKIQNVAASRLLGNPTGSPAALAEISLGTGMAFSGTALTTTALMATTNAASKSDQQTATSTAVYVPPAQQQSHPSAAKAWGFVTLSGGVASLALGYNVTSVSRTSAGIVVVNFTTAFSGAQYAAIGTITQSLPGPIATITATTLATGSVTFTTAQAATTTSTNASVTDLSFSFVCYGGQ